MTAFLILLSISIFGLAVAGWIFWREMRSSSVTAVEITPEEILVPDIRPIKKNASEGGGTSGIFAKLKIAKQSPAASPLQEPSETAPLPSLKEFLASQKIKTSSQGAASKGIPSTMPELHLIESEDPSISTETTSKTGESLKGTPLTAEEERTIMQELDLSNQVRELKEKLETAERLLQEKTQELEKFSQALEIELKNKKDYNKLKDILEKELKETKERARTLHMELTSKQEDIENHQRRIHELASKEEGLKERIVQQEEEINTLQHKQAKIPQENPESTSSFSLGTSATPLRPPTSSAEVEREEDDSLPPTEEPSHPPHE